MCVKHNHLQMFGLKLSKYVSIHPLEVVGRGSEPQQVTVGKNFS